MTIVYPPTFFVAGEEADADYLNSVVAKLPWGIVATPVATASNGTPTAADTTEVRDATLGNYVFTSYGTSRLYKVTYTGVLGNSATASSRMLARVRDSGSASTPTNSSTLLGEADVYVTETSTSGRVSGVLVWTFTAAAGVHTLSAFTQSPDSAIMTPVGSRQLLVEDIGPA